MSRDNAQPQFDRSLDAARRAMGPEGRAPRDRQGQSAKPTPVSDDLFLDHYLKRIDPAIASTFTEPQCEALKIMLGCRGAGRHLVDLRPTVSFGRRRYYLTLMFGRDRRTLTRVANIGLLERLRGVLGFVGLAVLLLTPVFALAYLIRELVDVEIQTSALFGLLSISIL